MESVEAVQWMKEQGIYDAALTRYGILKRVFTECLAVTSEKVLIIGDVGENGRQVAPIIAGAYYLAAQELNIEANFLLQGVCSRSHDASPEVQTALKELGRNSVVILSMSDKLGNLNYPSFRHFCQKFGHRFVSALSLGDLSTSQVNEVIEPMDINYKIMQPQLSKLREMLNDAEEIAVKTKNGTDFLFNIKGCEAILSDGLYLNPGQGGNLPAGEVFIPPNGKRVEGKIVIDGSSSNHRGTTIIKDMITLTVEDGSVAKIEGGEEAKRLEQAFDWAATLAKNPGAIRRIAELGFGFNPKARIIGSAVVDEKALGTSHVGIGSNHWFGGSIYATTHFGQIFREPIIKVDGKKINL
ncbi:MAG TPA: aminopeptidase [Candidatus Nanoarchaeia archaeon]|nr:aminopeptidase [Candidatus Nanoarchaeia archaeon]